MKKNCFSLLLSIVLVVSLSLSACSFGGVQTSGGVNGKDTLVIATSSEPPNLDSATSTDSSSFIIIGNTMEGLYRSAPDGKSVIPAISDGEPEISTDQLTYTFRLRDAKWSDGVKVKAQDFEFAWKRALDPQTASQYAFILEPIKNAMEYNAGKVKADEVGVKALDDQTLQVTLNQPTPFFLDLLAFITYMPQREDIVKKFGQDFAKEADKNVYNGPYQLTKWNHNQNYVMEKNERYWDASHVKLLKIDTKILKDTAARVNAFQTNQVQLIEVNDDFLAKFKDSSVSKVIDEPSAWYIELNHRKGFFQNKKIRQALNLAIDKKEYVYGVRKDKSIPAGSYIPPNLKANGQDQNKDYRELFPIEPQYQPQEAKRLFQEGLKEQGLSKAPIVEMVADDTSETKRQSEYVKETYRKNLGLEVKITSVPFKQRLKRGKDGQFDLLMSGWNGDYNDPMTFVDLFTSHSSYNRGKWSNQTYDQLVKKAKEHASGNNEERLQNMVKAEQILLEDAALVPLYYRSRMFLVKPEVQGIIFTQFGEDFNYKWTYIK